MLLFGSTIVGMDGLHARRPVGVGALVVDERGGDQRLCAAADGELREETREGPPGGSGQADSCALAVLGEKGCDSCSVVQGRSMRAQGAAVTGPRVARLAFSWRGKRISAGDAARACSDGALRSRGSCTSTRRLAPVRRREDGRAARLAQRRQVPPGACADCAVATIADRFERSHDERARRGPERGDDLSERGETIVVRWACRSAPRSPLATARALRSVPGHLLPAVSARTLTAGPWLRRAALPNVQS